MRRLYVTTLIGLVAGSALISSDLIAEDGHEGHAHAEQEVNRVPVTREQVEKLGIKISRAVKGTVRSEVAVPGSIELNENRLSHVVAQAAGIVRGVSATLGQRVKKGEVLAIIASRDLAEAKALYLAAVQRLALAKDVHAREKDLREQQVSSEQEFLETKQALAEAAILERSARQKLLTFGMAPAELAKLADEPEEQFASYRILAPTDGTVIERNIVLGEISDEHNTLFVIADLSTVWLDLEVSQDRIATVKKGQTVEVRMSGGVSAEGELEYVSPVVTEKTRNILARAILDNADGTLRPGTFVQAVVRVPSGAEAILIPKSSIQLVNDHPSVFVWGKAAFILREVTLGVTDGQQTEILTGLDAGEAVASENAFHLKAEYVKSMAGDMGAHAGHSH